MMNKKGKFITFEGIDGAGKSTQLTLICDFLLQNGINFVLTREPGGTHLSEKIRQLILNESMSIETEALLMFASRQEHFKQVILPNLEAGTWVISDRFVDSSYAYQCGGRGLNSEKIDILKQWTLGDFQPDLTFLFDTDPEIAHQRVVQSRHHLDRFEQMNVEFFQNVRAYFLKLSNEFPNRIKIINCSQSINTINDIIIQEVSAKILNK